MADLESIQQKIISFRNERDWAQFHDPKNLAETLSIAGKQLENFVWKTTEQSRDLSEELQNVKEEGDRNIERDFLCHGIEKIAMLICMI